MRIIMTSGLSYDVMNTQYTGWCENVSMSEFISAKQYDTIGLFVYRRLTQRKLYNDSN